MKYRKNFLLGKYKRHWRFFFPLVSLLSTSVVRWARRECFYTCVGPTTWSTPTGGKCFVKCANRVKEAPPRVSILQSARRDNNVFSVPLGDIIYQDAIFKYSSVASSIFARSDVVYFEDMYVLFLYTAEGMLPKSKVGWHQANITIIIAQYF
jgi:hypothetical protein